MNNDIENLRNELKKKVDEVIDAYVSKNMIDANDNGLVHVPEDKIYMTFAIGDQSYIAFTENEDDSEEVEMTFAKFDVVDGKKLLRDIGSDEEYINVVNAFNKLIGQFSTN